MAIEFDENDFKEVAGIRYANTFTFNLAKHSKEAGVEEERKRFIAYLTELGVIRDSMLGPNWRVIYTEQGAMDITLNRLENNE